MFVKSKQAFSIMFLINRLAKKAPYSQSRARARQLIVTMAIGMGLVLAACDGQKDGAAKFNNDVDTVYDRPLADFVAQLESIDFEEGLEIDYREEKLILGAYALLHNNFQLSGKPHRQYDPVFFSLYEKGDQNVILGKVRLKDRELMSSVFHKWEDSWKMGDPDYDSYDHGSYLKEWIPQVEETKDIYTATVEGDRYLFLADKGTSVPSVVMYVEFEMAVE